jgi:hypothetical protein
MTNAGCRWIEAADRHRVRRLDRAADIGVAEDLAAYDYYLRGNAKLSRIYEGSNKSGPPRVGFTNRRWRPIRPTRRRHRPWRAPLSLPGSSRPRSIRSAKSIGRRRRSIARWRWRSGRWRSTRAARGAWDARRGTRMAVSPRRSARRVGAWAEARSKSRGRALRRDLLSKRPARSSTIRRDVDRGRMATGAARASP